MQYIQVTFILNDLAEYEKDLLVEELGDIGYSTFADTDDGFSAFGELSMYNETSLKEIAEFYGDKLKYTVEEIAGENWNQEWEKNFEPLIISDECYVRATFHEPMPQYKYEIVIDPKMAFGTGHHQTTTMMMQYILSADLEDKYVLDMGCGTGILAILAAKRNAKALVAIDYDEVCYLSTIENAALNGVENITVICGSKEVIPQVSFEIILANINRNILLDQIEVYSQVLKEGGSIYFSGFYEHPDLEMITAECEKFGLKYLNHLKIGDWVAAHFKKD